MVFWRGGGENINIICHFHWIECACFLLYYFFSFLAAVIFCKNVINLVTDTQNYNNNISDNLQNMRLHKKPITLSTTNQHTVKTHIFFMVCVEHSPSLRCICSPPMCRNSSQTKRWKLWLKRWYICLFFTMLIKHSLSLLDAYPTYVKF